MKPSKTISEENTVKSFSENRHFIENEFEEAFYDASTGLDENALLRALEELKIAGGDLPYPIVYAKAYAFLFDHVQLQINEHTPFSVKLNLGVNYSYFASNTLFERAGTARSMLHFADKQIITLSIAEDLNHHRGLLSVGGIRQSF